MTKKNYKHLSETERLKIYALLFEGYSLQKIAESISRHKSTIYRELSRNCGKIGYRPDFASQQYLLRRRYQLSKIDRNEEIRNHILEKLKEGWSSEQIAGRLKREQGYTVVSYETIYQYIYSPSGKVLKLHQYLRKKRPYRYPRIRRKRRKANPDKMSIHERSEDVNNRESFGHWEGDLILFQKTKTNVLTLRERKTRFLIGIKNANRKAKETSKSLINYMSEKVDMMNSLTLDNDPAFAEYKGMAESLQSDIYFCDPYKSYQKGAIENGNRLIREKLPKRANIDHISQNRIEEIMNKLNRRPMKVLGFLSPKEAFLQERFFRGNL